MTNNADTWAILASGPSMSKEVSESVRPFRVIAVSNTYELAPWADILVSNDKSWWTNTPDARNFMGEKFCGLAIEPPRGVERFTGAMSGSNSALLAMQIAVSKGAKRILLFGVDLTGKHYFGDHPAPLRNPSAQRFEIFKKQFAAYQPKGVEIFNCSASSQLRAYKAASVEDFLPKEIEPVRVESPLILQGIKGEKGDPGKAIEGPRGPQGPKGDPGRVGPMPEHEWQGTALRFEKPDGSWGEAVNLKGQDGTSGAGVGGGAAIRDSVIGPRSTWSSAKIAQEIAEGGGAGAGGIQSVVAGENISVDSSDPFNPVVSATGVVGPEGPQGPPGEDGAPGAGGLTPEQTNQLLGLVSMLPAGVPSQVPVLALGDEPYSSGLSVEWYGNATNLMPGFALAANGIPTPTGGFSGETEVDWGDGVVENGGNTNVLRWSHEYATPGTYTAAARIRNHLGWSNTVTHEFTAE